MLGLANSYRAAGKFDLAVPLYEEVLKLRKAKLGLDPTDVPKIMGELGTTYWSLKRYDKSVPLFEELVSLEVKMLGQQHPDTQQDVANLGVSYKDAGRFKEAIPLLEEAHQSSKKFPMLREYDAALLEVYAKAGETAKLASLVQEHLSELRRTLPKDSPILARSLAQIGLGLLEQKKWTEAEPLLRECLAIREQKEPDDWRTFNTTSLLGGALLGQKKYADAEPLLRKGYEGMKGREKTIPPDAGTRLPEALDRLIALYKATNKPDGVKKWQAERAKYPAAASATQQNK